MTPPLPLPLSPLSPLFLRLSLPLPFPLSLLPFPPLLWLSPSSPSSPLPPPLLPPPSPFIFSEQLWQAVSKSWGALGSEQDQFNRALRNRIKWNTTSLNTTSPDALCTQKYGWRGISKITDFSLLLLPQSKFCRGSCCDGSGYDLADVFIAHGGGGTTGDTNRKILYSKSRGVWFLKRNWRKLKRSSSTGVDWLRQLSTI